MAIPSVSSTSARLEIGLRFHSHTQSDLVHLFMLHMQPHLTTGKHTHTHTQEMSHPLYESYCLILNLCGDQLKKKKKTT